MLASQENDVEVNGRKVHYRVIGDYKKEKKAHVLPVLCLGDAGLSMDDLESLDLLVKSERRIIRIDLLGTGASERLQQLDENVSRSQLVSIAAAETRAVLASLGIDTSKQNLHVFCCGFGLDVVAALVAPRIEDTSDSQHQQNFKLVSAAVEPSWTRRKATSNSFPVCAADAISRGNDKIASIASRAGSTPQESSSALLDILVESCPVLCVMSELHADPSYELHAAELKYFPGPTGSPHLDDYESVLRELDSFFIKHESSHA